MARIVRAAVAIVAGMLAVFLLVVAVELFSAVVHPLPENFGGTKEEICQHVERYPNWVLAVVVAAWGGTALTGTWIAGRLGNRGCALFMGVLLFTALVFNISMLPYPIWFKTAILMVIPSAIVAGLYLTGRRHAV